ncbi:MAG: hypothetical protein H0S79_26220 [Anaerolineaceae bacterium]|nr:hypothetical protein [Anaerolineaceae bacterium]
MKKTLTRMLYFFILMILTSGCLRLASSATVDLSQFTPQPSLPAEDDMGTEITPTSALDAATLNTLRLFPLWVGSTWVYDYLGYSPDEEAHWRVTETVVYRGILQGHYVAEVERTVELTLGDPPLDFPSYPPVGSFYYLVDGENVYRFEGQVEADLDDAWLEWVLPFPADEGVWVPNPWLRASEGTFEIGSRFAQGPFDQVVSESGTKVCYNVVTSVEEGAEEATFCEGIGVLFWEADNGQGSGYRMEMIGFVVQ